ncbi:condensation domain-containing protein [Streptomyces sp. NBC_00083]|uniref:non-ribosomal peptide synthetase n=1 Tax=Streptomyces sp. NBC_00083 TaxID=2975647 RepID=UPI00224DCFDB|nr:condensation domain-containing protein [Streptomyces sp. NBC_00083]MCX5386219.1 condensation domain-containing protein [Streptomyces sp. NBC_00083]
MTDHDLRKRLETALRARAGQARTEHPLSYAQSSLLLLHQMDPDSASYNVALTARFTGGFDSAVFHRALQSLVGRHASLRTTFSRAGADDGGGPTGRQTVHGWLEPDFAELDARQWTEKEVQEAVRAAYREPFALVSGSPLRVRSYRVAPGEAVVLLAAHHVVCDFWSLGTMLAELEQLYAAEAERRPAGLPGNNRPYSDFVAYQRELMAGERGAGARAYWHAQLAGPVEPVRWPQFDLDPADTDGGGSLMFPLPAELAADVFALAKAEAVTPYAVLLTAFQILVGRYTGRHDVLVGSPFAGRTDPALSECVGNFMNPVVLRADLSDAVSFREQLGRTRRTVAEAFEHQDYPFELLVGELAPRRTDGRNPLFQTMFIYQKSGRHPAHAALHVADDGASPAAWAGLTAAPFPLDKQDDQLELLLEVVHDGDRLVGVLKYRKSVFSAAAAGRAAEHYTTLLRAAVTDPDRAVPDLPLLDEAGHGDGRSPEPVSVAPDDSLAARFRQAAEQYAHRTAVRCGADELTYAGLDELAGRWAARLRAEGVRPGSRVALLLEPSLDTVAALVAVQRVRAAHVVLDPSWPAAWHRAVLDDSGAHLVLTQPDLAGLLAGAAVPVLVMPDTELPPAGEPGDLPRAGDVAHTVYTSGPAGTPLGTDIEHGNVLALLESMREHAAFDETAVGALFHPAGSEPALWGALLAGACLVVVAPGEARSPDRVHALLVEERVTHLVQTPSALHGLDAVIGRTGAEGLALRHVFSCGGPLPAPLARNVRAWCGTLWTGYGPAETTGWVTAQPVRPEDCAGTAVPAGLPLANGRIHILDEHGHPVPREFTGELHIGGPCVGRGYVDQPGLTKERFLESPLEPGGRLFRTGDLARIDTTGRLHLLGRADNQVVVDGFRAELQGLEARLDELAGVARSAALLVGEGADDRRLVACVVPEPGADVTESALLAELGSALPPSLLPTEIRSVDAFPLDADRRTDRAALAAHFAGAAARTGAAGAPSDHERRVTAVWQQVLRRQDIGRDDNFFDLGGTSMLLAQVHELLAGDAVNQPLKGSELFRYPTVATLAARLGRAASEPAAGAGRDRGRTAGRRARPADDTVRGARLRARERGGKNA